MLPRGNEGGVVRALRLQDLSKITYPLFLVYRVKEIKRDKSLEPSSLAPGKKLYFAALEKLVVVFHYSVYYVGDALVTGAIVVYGKRFCNKNYRPRVVFGALVILTRTDPSVRLLTLENAVDISFYDCDLFLVLKQISKRNKSVKPIGNLFPARVFAADPHTLADVAPHVVQIASESLCLNFKLTAKPARRLYFVGSIKLPLVHNIPPSFFIYYII